VVEKTGLAHMVPKTGLADVVVEILGAFGPPGPGAHKVMAMSGQGFSEADAISIGLDILTLLVFRYASAPKTVRPQATTSSSIRLLTDKELAEVRGGSRSGGRPETPALLVPDGSGRIHGEIPKSVPKNWDRQDLIAQAEKLRESIKNREINNTAHGGDASPRGPTHRERITEESEFLGMVLKRLDQLEENPQTRAPRRPH
jgi:hypothetical protein